MNKITMFIGGIVTMIRLSKMISVNKSHFLILEKDGRVQVEGNMDREKLRLIVDKVATMV